MTRIIIFIFIQLALVFILDLYAYDGIVQLSRQEKGSLPIALSYIIITLLSYAGAIRPATFLRKTALQRSFFVNLWFGTSLSFIVAKVVFVLLLFVTDALRWLMGGVWKATIALGNSHSVPEDLLNRPYWVILVVSTLGLLVLLSLIFGVLAGKYRFKIEHSTVYLDDLPQEFHGFRILHLSDAHSGSWDSITGVKKGIDLANDQKADIIVFTGDLVNQFKDEINPYIDLFQSLKAPFGKYAILGNHDYYGQPPERDKRPAYWSDFYAKYEEMGFELLLNEHRMLQNGDSAIGIAGVENWGAGRFFPKRGELEKALEGLPDDLFVLLMSHDPTHWEEKVLPHERKIQLTLSGHTHGMQFGINLPFLKWSPIKYRYKNWLGWYENTGRRLYVNRGFGYLGFPGRVGMWPEIAVIELRSTSIRQDQ